MSVLEGSLVAVLVSSAATAVLADQLDQPPVPGYLILGLLLGPGLSAASMALGVSFKLASGGLIDLVSELGLVFLLFLVGLQVKIDEIRDSLSSAVPMSLVQSLGVVAAVLPLCLWLGLSTDQASVAAVALVPSSAAVVVPLLGKQGDTSSSHGTLDVSNLVVQSILMVLVLGVLSSLGGNPLVGGAKVLASVLGLGALSWVCYRFVAPEVMERVSNNQESFLLGALSVPGLFAGVSFQAGLSAEIGAFFAGAALAQLPSSEELYAEFEPLTEFFLAAFLVSVGLGLSVSALSRFWAEALLVSLILVPLKAGLYFASGRVSGVGQFVSARSSLDLAQVSDLSLVVGAVAVSTGLIGEPFLAFLSVVALVTMTASSLLIVHGRGIVSRVFDAPEREQEDPNPVLLGYNAMGERIEKVLRERFGQVTIVDRSVGTTSPSVGDDELVFGSLEHEEVRRSCSLSSAPVIVSVKEDLDVELEVLKESPSCPVVLSSDDREASLELLELGADYVIDEKILSSEELVDKVRKR